MADPWEMDWGQTAQPAAATAQKAPWEMDWGATEKPSGKSFTEKLGETSWGHLAKDIYGAVTLPGDVYAGRIDPGSDEAIGRSFEAAKVFTPVPAAMRAGEGIFSVPMTAAKPSAGSPIVSTVAEDLGDPFPRGVTPAIGAVRNLSDKIFAAPSGNRGVTPGISAAITANELGAPLPRGLAADSKVMQAATKAAQQLPLVGPKIGEQAARTVEAAGGKVGDIADELAGGVVDRASAGAVLRPSIKGVIEGNNSRIDDAFTSLRGMIDQSEPTLLPTTEKVVSQIIKDRQAAGHVNPSAGLEDIKNLVDKGATFDGLQRARSDIGNALNFGEANPGFNAGDLKRVYAAMSRDMEGVVSQSAKLGVEPKAAVQALKDANATSAPIIEFNKTLQRLSGIKSDESLVGSLTKAAQDKTGNVKLLAQLRQGMPKEEFEQISGQALSELGHNTSTGKFSLNQFATKWEKLGDRAKSVLFSPEHKASLDSIAQLGRHLKDADKFANTSNTAGAAAWGKLIAGGAAAIGALAYGDVSLLIKGLGAAGGGLLFANQLAKPATASSVAKWTRAAVLAEHGHTPQRLATFRLATRNLLSNLQTQPANGN